MEANVFAGLAVVAIEVPIFAITVAILLKIARFGGHKPEGDLE